MSTQRETFDEGLDKVISIAARIAAGDLRVAVDRGGITGPVVDRAGERVLVEGDPLYVVLDEMTGRVRHVCRRVGVTHMGPSLRCHPGCPGWPRDQHYGG